MNKKLVLLATDRYSININDFYMFYRRTGHQIEALVHHTNCPEKKWWAEGRFPDPAREKLLDPLDLDRLKLVPYSEPDEVPGLLDGLDFDYVCMGNGNAEEHRRVVDHIGIERCLFTEYGWLPWSKNFYISRGGCGVRSEIRDVDAATLDRQPLREAAVEGFRRTLSKGWPVLRKGFVYVPLQKDVNDFKFTFCNFQNNVEFLDFIHGIVPRGMRIVVKEHPLYRQHYDYAKYGRGRFTDISDKKLNKAMLYRNMAAMICINSTSILEALAFGGKVFAYGEDLYMNKDLVHFRVTDSSEFERLLGTDQSRERCDRFISLLMERQVDRRRCLTEDRDYIEGHYWNRAI